jgi:hypothetical protein
MPLPKIDAPLFTLKMPSTNKTLSCRPFLVKEEKILLMAQQSGEEREIIFAIKQILTNCIQDKSFDADKLTTFDLEYMFLQLRARSVDNKAKLSYRDLEDDKVYDFEIDLDDVKLDMKKADTKIPINDEMGIMMKYPTIDFLERLPEVTTAEELTEMMISSCIDKVYDSENVYDAAEQTPEELQGFIDYLNVNVYNKIKEFITTIPTMSYTIKYTNSLGNERKIELTSLKDFFTWG